MKESNMESERKLNYQYRIIYETGKSRGCNNFLAFISVTKEDYIKIIRGLLNNIPLEEIEGIAEVIARMKKDVTENDVYFDMNGRLLKTRLKKPRAIKSIELSVPESEYSRFRKMRDPAEAINRQEEHMTIFRSDGSCVKISSENGQVTVTDSRKKGTCTISEADYFISLIVR